MINKKLFLIIFIPLFFSLVKADGCGLICPKGDGSILGFVFKFICLLFTWSFCHIVSFFIVFIVVVIIVVYWYQRPEKSRKKVKIYLYLGSFILIMICLYPYIRAWVTTPLSVSTTTTTIYTGVPCDPTYNEACNLRNNGLANAFYINRTSGGYCGQNFCGQPDDNLDYFYLYGVQNILNIYNQTSTGWLIYAKDSPGDIPSPVNCYPTCCGNYTCEMPITSAGDYYILLVGTSPQDYLLSVSTDLY
jgi:hypothetical protein